MPHPVFFDKKLEIYRDTVAIRDYHAPRVDKRLPVVSCKVNVILHG
jgi:hypothetical protein